jgi:uncharacterized protein YcbX
MTARVASPGMWLAQLWRYPVKSMGGEALQTAQLAADGIAGDRLVHVEDGRGRLVTSRSRPRLLLHRGRLGSDGAALVDGRRWSSDEVAADVEKAAGPGARLVGDGDGSARFDVLPLLVATDGAIAAFGYDGRRLRPNLVIGGVSGLAEREWEGRTLRIGQTLIRAVDLRQRCIMTTFDPDTADQDVEVLRLIHRRFDGALALNCEVIQPGVLHVGDVVELIN